MKRLIVTVLVAALSLIATPANAHPATKYGRATLDRDRQCRMQQVDRASWTHHEVVKTVRCAGRAFGNRADVRKALFVGTCESGLTAEKAPHSTPYHSTFQYLSSTFASQQAQMPVVVRRYDLSDKVHNPRANVIMAVAWGIRRTWSPWSCAS